MLVSVAIAMSVREFARAWTASRLHDPTPRLWGRLTLNPASWFDPFGSGLLPVLTAIMWSAGVFLIPAAYGKPAPVDPGYFKRPTRDIVLVSCAGPLATLVLGIATGLLVRVGSTLPLEVFRFGLVWTFTSMSLVVFHLLPIPGLDGARIVALLLPPQAREVYRNADKYLPLIVLVVLFIFGTVVLGFLTTISGALCNAATGFDCERLLGL